VITLSGVAGGGGEVGKGKWGHALRGAGLGGAYINTLYSDILTKKKFFQQSFSAEI